MTVRDGCKGTVSLIVLRGLVVFLGLPSGCDSNEYTQTVVGRRRYDLQRKVNYDSKDSTFVWVVVSKGSIKHTNKFTCRTFKKKRNHLPYYHSLVGPN